ncbi:MAG: hypothetical protein ACREPM_01595 [Gemmatimonadaceae bacterium]
MSGCERDVGGDTCRHRLGQTTPWSVATDSKGNIFTTETYEGKRIQKFTYKGIGSVATSQGVVWPKR